MQDTIKLAEWTSSCCALDWMYTILVGLCVMIFPVMCIDLYKVDLLLMIGFWSSWHVGVSFLDPEELYRISS